MENCECCYCKSKCINHNNDYINGLKFAINVIDEDVNLRKEGIKRWKISLEKKEITYRIYCNRVQYLQNQMDFLVEQREKIAKEANKYCKIVPELNHDNILYED